MCVLLSNLIGARAHASQSQRVPKLLKRLCPAHFHHLFQVGVQGAVGVLPKPAERPAVRAEPGLQRLEPSLQR